MQTLRRLSAKASLAVFTTAMFVQEAFAQTEGSFAGQIPAIPGTPSAASEDDVRNIILDALTFVLDFLALLAVVFIVVAGIRLIVSQGSDDQKDKAKKTIFFVIIGLLIILFARVIVGFFTSTVAEQF